MLPECGLAGEVAHSVKNRIVLVQGRSNEWAAGSLFILKLTELSTLPSLATASTRQSPDNLFRRSSGCRFATSSLSPADGTPPPGCRRGTRYA